MVSIAVPPLSLCSTPRTHRWSAEPGNPLFGVPWPGCLLGGVVLEHVLAPATHGLLPQTSFRGYPWGPYGTGWIRTGPLRGPYGVHIGPFGEVWKIAPIKRGARKLRSLVVL